MLEGQIVVLQDADARTSGDRTGGCVIFGDGVGGRGGGEPAVGVEVLVDDGARRGAVVVVVLMMLVVLMMYFVPVETCGLGWGFFSGGSGSGRLLFRFCSNGYLHG